MKHLTRETTNGAAQGEILLIPVDSIPEDAKPVQGTDGFHVVAHSETGHHHRMPSNSVDLFQAANDALTQFVDVKRTAVLEHLRKEHTHEAYEVEPGAYLVRTARESALRKGAPNEDGEIVSDEQIKWHRAID